MSRHAAVMPSLIAIFVNEIVMPQEKSWYKQKNYLHFDYALDQSAAENYVTNPDNIIHHRFVPFIHYKIKSRKVKRNLAAERYFKTGKNVLFRPRLKVKKKERNIFYASHIDGYIYSYYAKMLQEKYDNYVNMAGFSDNVIAYRSISKNGVNFSNIHFADEAFRAVRNLNRCHVLCFDLTRFFDNISPDILKENWKLILDVTRLPDDHFKVYKNITNFCYVEESRLIEEFKGISFDKTPRCHGRYSGSGSNRICNFTRLRELNIISNKGVLDIDGIPQGTSISGLLSNIFMLNFDLNMKNFVERLGGYYRRYSDDIFVAVPALTTFDDVENCVNNLLNEFCAGSVKINNEKTEKKIFSNADGICRVTDVQTNNLSRIQYLGFIFDGNKVYLRNSTVSKNKAKIVQLIRKKRKRKMVGGQLCINTREVYKKRSHVKTNRYNSDYQKGYVNYAYRAHRVHGNSSGISSQVRKDHYFIKRAIARERKRRVRKY